jgi:alpha-tubulin suppressor-like RCC1 family protein
VADLANKNIRMIAAGGNRTGAISDSGRLYIWGAGSKGESGDGSTRSHRKPNLVQAFIGSTERVCQVAIGGSHVVAVTNAGDLYAWGDGAAGQVRFYQPLF